VSLDQQVSELTARVRRLEKREPPLAGTFIDSATTPADDLRVIAPDWDDGEHAFGPVRWHPIGGALPQVGDECMIVERSDGVWAVAGWWSDSQGTGIAQSTIDALDARLDALEGASKVAFPYASGWADRGAGFESASYSLHGTTVALQGLVTKTGGTPSAGDIIGTLPSGHRPTGTLIFEVSTGATDARGRIHVESSGNVTWQAGSTTETDKTASSRPSSRAPTGDRAAREHPLPHPARLARRAPRVRAAGGHVQPDNGADLDRGRPATSRARPGRLLRDHRGPVADGRRASIRSTCRSERPALVAS
jgi:hypothetical protein